MLCRKIRQILHNKSNWNNNLQHILLSTRLSKKCVSIDGFWAIYRADIGSMSPVRFVMKDLSIMRLWSAWRRSYFISTVVKRCRRDRGVRDVIQRFRHTLLRPRQTLLLSATAAYKSNNNGGDSVPSCEQNITDEELQNLMKELDRVNELSRNTLFCVNCGKRLVIDRKLAGVTYCSCKDSKPGKTEEENEGWVPYMEAEDVIVWRKQYKPGKPFYAYKVYGRYKDLRAQDFAAVQTDGAYRKVWDAAVASLSVVERQARGLDQAVLHWEVLWPRLFANRDYVYIRRHKEFTMLHSPANSPASLAVDSQRPSVHSHAKRKAMESDMKEKGDAVTKIHNKVFIIASRSCEHDKVPEAKHVVRVADFWSHMVIKTLEGPDKAGMEFVLTYYEEPAVGGLPSGVATWATGRAAPAFLEKQRRAAAEYRTWRGQRTPQDLADYIAFSAETEANLDRDVTVREPTTEPSKVPDTDKDLKTRQDQSTQTDDRKLAGGAGAQDASVATDNIVDKEQPTTVTETKKPEVTTAKPEPEIKKPVVTEKREDDSKQTTNTDADGNENEVIVVQKTELQGNIQDGGEIIQNVDAADQKADKSEQKQQNDVLNTKNNINNDRQANNVSTAKDDVEKTEVDILKPKVEQKTTMEGDKATDAQNTKDCHQNGAETIQNGAETIQNGAETIQNGAENIQNGAENVQNGAENVQNGAETIQNGAENVQNGAETIQNGDRNEQKQDGESENECKDSNARWWRYLYPFYYFA